VVFWFALLGPTGAWFFRVLDLMRRRAIENFADSHSGVGDEPPQILRATLALHRLAAWIPARLLMAGYAFAGNYDGATAAWRQPLDRGPELFPGPDDRRLGLVGCGAAPDSDEVDVASRAAVALRLVIRVLWMIWCPALALLTLYGWLN
jgi:AmpE protein